MSLYNQYETNQDAECNGFKLEMPEAENKDKTIPFFILSRMGKTNRAYSKALEVATRPYRRQLELGTMPNEKAEEITKNVFVGNVLKDWGNVQDRKGVPIKFSREAAIKLLTELPELYERLQEEAKLAANFRVSALEEEAKN